MISVSCRAPYVRESRSRGARAERARQQLLNKIRILQIAADRDTPGGGGGGGGGERQSARAAAGRGEPADPYAYACD